MTGSPARCSIGIMAWDEERNIGRLLDILTVPGGAGEVEISEIIVVASGCTDGTADLVRAAAARDPRVKLVEQPVREGKPAAINTFLSTAREEVCVMLGADTLPAPDAVAKLVAPFADAKTGMAGARPMPLNKPDTFAGYTVQLLWRIHHEVSLIQPKCGEAVAFRRVFGALPPGTIVDEPAIEALVRGAGLNLVYVPDAVVYNLGPATVREIIMRRRSIVRGYLELSKTTHMRSSTQARRMVALAALRRMLSGEEPFFRALGAMMVELAARLLGRLDFHLNRNPGHLWPAAKSTKSPGDYL